MNKRAIAFLVTLAHMLRVRDWAKNLFVFAPLIFSEQLSIATALGKVVIVSGALCLLSSSIYILNDLLDASRDRKHPVKRHRPIASGQVSLPAAVAVAIACVVGGYGLLFVLRAPAAVWWLATGFLALNVAYSCYLKHKVIVDVLAIAVGYVLRVLIGGAAIGVPVTHWLILCTFLLAVFLGFSKRRHELVVLGETKEQHRAVLELYTEEFLDRMSILTLAMTLTCYILYTIAPETIVRFGTNALVYSSLIVMFGLFRYLFLIHVKKMGSPVEVVYSDRQIVLAVVAWLLYVIVVVYTWPNAADVLR